MVKAFGKHIATLSLIAFVLGCSPKVDTRPLVFTEDIIFVSGEILRVTGRIVAAGEVELQDHGFYIDTDQSFSNPTIISMGDRQIPGRFIGINESLNINTEYFVKAFIETSSGLEFGETLPFRTLDSTIGRFTPHYHDPGGLITIYGTNLTSDTEVYIGNLLAERFDFKFESILRVRLPVPEPGAYEVPVRVISDGKEMEFDDAFEYVIGKWDQVSTFPGAKSFGRSAFFTAENKLYTGFQREPDNLNNLSFWRFDPGNSSWEQIQFNGTFVKHPARFEGGFLGGEIGVFFGTYIASQEFWVVKNGQLVSEGVLPFPTHRSVAHRQGDDLYVFGGWDAAGEFVNDIWKYDFNTKQWVLFDFSPIEIFNLNPSFEYGGTMYFLTSDKKMFNYDPSSKVWNEMASYPGETINRAIGVTFEDVAIVGQAGQNRSIFEYSFSEDSWKRKVPVPLTHPADIALSVWVLNDRYFALRSNGVGISSPRLFEFDPFNY